jgi:hypothetical protein
MTVCSFECSELIEAVILVIALSMDWIRVKTA